MSAGNCSAASDADAHAGKIERCRECRREVDRRRGARRRVEAIRTRDRGGDQRGVLGGMREWADRVEHLRQQVRTMQAHESIGRLEAGQPAQCRRHANRSAGVRTQRGRNQAGRHGDSGARRRSGRHAVDVRIPRIPRRPHRLVATPATERELDHVRFAQWNHAGFAQSLDDGGGEGRSASQPTLRSGGGLPAFDVQQVLEGDRQSMQGPAHRAGAAFEIGRVSECARIVGIDLDERMQPGVVGLDAGEAGIHDGA